MDQEESYFEDDDDELGGIDTSAKIDEATGPVEGNELHRTPRMFSLELSQLNSSSPSPYDEEGVAHK